MTTTSSNRFVNTHYIMVSWLQLTTMASCVNDKKDVNDKKEDKPTREPLIITMSEPVTFQFPCAILRRETATVRFFFQCTSCFWNANSAADDTTKSRWQQLVTYYFPS